MDSLSEVCMCDDRQRDIARQASVTFVFVIDSNTNPAVADGKRTLNTNSTVHNQLKSCLI